MSTWIPPLPKYCFENWPTPVTFTGFEIGDKVKTGLRLIGSAVRHSPVKDAFRIAMAGSKDDLNGHSSWGPNRCSDRNIWD